MALSTTGILRIGANVSIPSSLKHHQQQHRVSAPAMMVVECSSRPQKKATAHHMKTRPKKRQRWDIKRGGTTPYPPLPPLPPDWTLVSSSSSEEEQQQQQMEQEAEETVVVSDAP